MADYQSLLTRAVANLPSGGTPATREAIYVRARKALIEQLRSLRPPLPESDIAREANALDAAIAQVEAKFGPQQAASSSNPSPRAARAASRAPRRRQRRNPPRRPRALNPGLAFQRPVAPGSPQSAPMAGSSALLGKPAATAVANWIAGSAGAGAERVRSSGRFAAADAVSPPAADPAGFRRVLRSQRRLRESRPPVSPPAAAFPSPGRPEPAVAEASRPPPRRARTPPSLL